MSTCDHRFLDEPTGLTCTRADTHTTGHTYEASDAPDRHTEHADD